MLCKFDESIAAFKDSSEYLNGVVEAEKRKEEQNEKTEATIKEIEETRQEIANKIIEVQEAKDQVSDEQAETKIELRKINNRFLLSIAVIGRGETSDSIVHESDTGIE